MNIKFHLSFLCLLMYTNFNALNAQNKLHLLTSIEIEQLKTANTVEEAMKDPDSIQSFFTDYGNLNAIPKELEKCKNLIMIEIGDDNIKEIPPFVFNLTKLQILGFSHNQISIIPKEISRLKNLTSILIWGNKITEVPQELLKLPNIQKIGLKGNPIPKEEQERLRKTYSDIEFTF